MRHFTSSQIPTLLFPVLRRCLLILCLPLVLATCSLGAGGKGHGPRIFMTTQDQSVLFEEMPVVKAKASACITISDTKSGRPVAGFGPALTGASCYNLLRMPQAERTALLKELFDPAEGLGMSLVRCSIGASDFSVDEDFTWCDTPGLEHFAVHPEDRDYLFPILREVYAINPELRIIGSPWSCPKWMKQESVEDPTPHPEWRGGSLMKACYADYARYFVRWIETMQAEGFSIFAVTPQNEPLHAGNSMSLYMTWEEQSAFVGTALGPALREAGLDTRILVFDHNYNYDRIADQKDYPLHIFADTLATRYSAGSAWHNYGGKVSELDHIRAAAPDKEIYFTEASIGSWNYDFPKCLIRDFKSIFLGTLARGGQGVTLWNLALDEHNRPFRPRGCSTCYGVITVSSEDASILSRNSQYYDLAHCSKVVKPGAEMLSCSGPDASGLEYLAFANPDGSTGVLILNESDADQILSLRQAHKKEVRCLSAAHSIVSVLLPVR